MSTKRRVLENDEGSINLLTTLLVRYPELCTINYSPKGNLLKLGFVISDELEEAELKRFNQNLAACINTYHHFSTGLEPGRLRINHTYGPGITILEITRDTATLSQKEIDLIIGFIRGEFGKDIIVEDFYFQEEDILEHDDFICSLLDDLRQENPKSKLLAVREKGRVLVFQR